MEREFSSCVVASNLPEDKNKNTYSTLREKNLQFILHISVKDNDLKRQKQTNISRVHYPKEIIYLHSRDDNYSNNQWISKN